jgi:hypothetical protein
MLSKAKVGQQKTFEVGKDQQQCIYNLCDTLEVEMPGLKLHHESVGASRGRSLFVALVRTFPNAQEQKYEPMALLESPFMGTGH